MQLKAGQISPKVTEIAISSVTHDLLARLWHSIEIKPSSILILGVSGLRATHFDGMFVKTMAIFTLLENCIRVVNDGRQS